jgi:hypothetical protein
MSTASIHGASHIESKKPPTLLPRKVPIAPLDNLANWAKMCEDPLAQWEIPQEGEKMYTVVIDPTAICLLFGGLAVTVPTGPHDVDSASVRGLLLSATLRAYGLRYSCKGESHNRHVAVWLKPTPGFLRLEPDGAAGHSSAAAVKPEPPGKKPKPSNFGPDRTHPGAESVTKIPGLSNFGRPGCNAAVKRAEPKRPESAPKRPESAPKRPESAPKRPESAPKRPESAPKRPEFAPKRPEPADKPLRIPGKNPTLCRFGERCNYHARGVCTFTHPAAAKPPSSGALLVWAAIAIVGIFLAFLTYYFAS